ncbi:MAG: hypothetical protein M0Q88_00100 [Bacilli bacterium]|nr:hypothetical protein [Bacilli bacterium]
MNCGELKPKKQNLFKRIKSWWQLRKLRKQPSEMEKWARRELELLEVGCEDKDELMMQKSITNNVMNIVKEFCNEGHSGFSASYTLNLIKRLLAYKPIKPLTGEDDEWSEVKEWDKERKLQQNKRCSAVFRENFDNSTAHYNDGKVFSNNGGRSWYGKGGSSVPVTFPFKVPLEPEYVYLDKEGNVITREEAKELFKEEE